MNQQLILLQGSPVKSRHGPATVLGSIAKIYHWEIREGLAYDELESGDLPILTHTVMTYGR